MDALKAHDLVTAQRLEERLKAAVDQAAQDKTVDFHIADSCRPLHAHDWRSADETDLNALYRLLMGHAWQATGRNLGGNRWNYLLGACSSGARISPQY
jgi:hypothetical protein